MTESLRGEIEKLLVKLAKDIANQPLDTLIEPLEEAYEKLLIADYLAKRNERKNALQEKVLATLTSKKTQETHSISLPKEETEVPKEPAKDSQINLSPEIKVLPIPEGPPPMMHEEEEAVQPVTEPKVVPNVTKAKVVANPEPEEPKEVKKASSIAEKAQAENTKKSLHAKLAAKKLSFGLNDRLAYVKHLFEGNNEDFNRVISQLNTFEDWEEAEGFINEMVKPDFDWNGKTEYEERFLTHLKTKFE